MAASTSVYDAEARSAAINPKGSDPISSVARHHVISANRQSHAVRPTQLTRSSRNLALASVALLALATGAAWHVFVCFLEAEEAAVYLCRIRDRARPFGAPDDVDDETMVASLADCASEEFACRLSVSGDDYAKMVECETRGDIDIISCRQPESGRAAAAAVRCRDGMPEVCRERALVDPLAITCPDLPPLRTQ